MELQIWARLATTPKDFVLYGGGAALALRLGRIRCPAQFRQTMAWSASAVSLNQIATPDMAEGNQALAYFDDLPEPFPAAMKLISLLQ